MEFHLLISANMEQLQEFLRGISHESSIEAFYAHCLLHYHWADIDQIKAAPAKATELFSTNPELSPLLTALQLRQALRERKVSAPALNEAARAIPKAGRWQGELGILIGSCFTVLGDHAQAKTFFQASANAFDAIGAPKALKSRFNALVAESHLDDKANLIPRYFELHRRSLKKDMRDEAIAGLCLLNISREYELIGSLHAALKYASEALEISEANFGTMQYYLTLAHRAHLFTQLGRYAEARIDYECASTANFLEVKAALEVVKAALVEHVSDLNAEVTKPSDKIHLTPTWSARQERSPHAKFSQMESALLDYLGNGPKSKIDILLYLYGEALEYEVKLNRFKSLIGTLRRKSPHIIVNENGFYRLAEQITRPKKKANP